MVALCKTCRLAPCRQQAGWPVESCRAGLRTGPKPPQGQDNSRCEDAAAELSAPELHGVHAANVAFIPMRTRVWAASQRAPVDDATLGGEGVERAKHGRHRRKHGAEEDDACAQASRQAAAPQPLELCTRSLLQRSTAVVPSGGPAPGGRGRSWACRDRAGAAVEREEMSAQERSQPGRTSQLLQW